MRHGDLIWVKVLKCTPLRGPLEGEIAFSVEWERCTYTRPRGMAGDYGVFKFGGKKHTLYDIANPGYGTVCTNFKHFSPFFNEDNRPTQLRNQEYVTCEGEGRIFILSASPNESGYHGHKAWMNVEYEEPPIMRQWTVWHGDGNDRNAIERDVEHWNPHRLLDEMIKKHMKPEYALIIAKEGNFDGDDVHAVVSYNVDDQEDMHCMEVSLS